MTTLPATGLNPPTGAILSMSGSSISCPTITSCVVAGGYGYELGWSSFVATLSNGAWTLQSVPTSSLSPPASTEAGYAQISLFSISCKTTSSCVSVGFYYDSSRTYDMFAATLANGEWTVSTLPSTGLSPAQINYITPAGISCPTTSSCVATGNYMNANGGFSGFTATLANGTWTLATLPSTGLSPSPRGGNYMMPAGISCATATSCVIAGTYVDTSNNSYAFTATLTNGTWGIATLTLTGLNPSPGSNTGVGPAGISCATAISCSMSGWYLDNSQNSEGFVATLTGGTWDFTTIPISDLSPAVADNPGMSPSGISCPTTSSCVTTGYYSGRQSNSVPFAASAPASPQSPTGVSAVAGDSQVSVSWTASARATSYTAIASPGGQACTTTTTSCVIAGLMNGATYSISVKASNSSGTSDPSPDISITTTSTATLAKLAATGMNLALPIALAAAFVGFGSLGILEARRRRRKI